VFVSGNVSLDAGIVAARSRLAGVIRNGLMGRASAQAYISEITGLARVGPPGSVPGLSRVVKVLVQDLKAPGDPARFALRWEAAGPGGALFLALDADITLTPAGEHSTTLTLTGAYRPPPGAALDREVLHRVAMATIRAFLHDIAEAAAHRATAAEPQAEAHDPDPPPLPATT
jgi:hypothetical protein